MAVLSLIRSAFGHTCLYKSLDAPPTSTSDDLKRAYRQAALKYHPDRASISASVSDAEVVAASTLKFQAVSAAYQILMDEKKRSIYDSTGKIIEDSGIECSEDDYYGNYMPKKASHTKSHNNDSWEAFFYSVFQEMISVNRTHDADAKSYRGSSREKSDVMKYYKICKGDWSKVIECVSFGTRGDIERWKREIIAPSSTKEQMQDFGCASGKTTVIIQNKDIPFEGEDGIHLVNSKNQKVAFKSKEITLDDSTSDEEDIPNVPCKKRRLKKKTQKIKTQTNQMSRSLNAPSMSKKDKLEYRTAKIRKEKMSKEIELAEIFQSKDWGDAFSTSMNSKSRKCRFSK